MINYIIRSMREVVTGVTGTNINLTFCQAPESVDLLYQAAKYRYPYAPNSFFGVDETAEPD